MKNSAFHALKKSYNSILLRISIVDLFFLFNYNHSFYELQTISVRAVVEYDAETIAFSFHLADVILSVKKFHEMAQQVSRYSLHVRLYSRNCQQFL